MFSQESVWGEEGGGSCDRGRGRCDQKGGGVTGKGGARCDWGRGQV